MWIFLWEQNHSEEAHENKKEENKCDKCIAQFKTSMKPLNHMTECQKGSKKDKSYCYRF